MHDRKPPPAVLPYHRKPSVIDAKTHFEVRSAYGYLRCAYDALCAARDTHADLLRRVDIDADRKLLKVEREVEELLRKICEAIE